MSLMQEQIFEASNGVLVKYKHKPAKYDYNHIIFVFSGFNNPLPGKRWDLNNIMKDCPCDVIWISDDFEGMHSYYLCIDLDFKVENSVSEFIEYQKRMKSLGNDNITLTGFSKGATAALYYSLKMNISNVVLTVPQTKIGSYVDFEWKDAAKHIMGENYTSIHMKYLDNIIPRMLKEDSNLAKNIYLLTSEEDIQFKEHIEPILKDLSRYSNFNIIKSHSLLVRQHRDVATHHTPILLGIYYALASEAVPRFNDGEVNFFGNQKILNSKPSLEAIVDLEVFRIENSRLFIEGVGILRGWHTDKWSDINYELLINGKVNYVMKLSVGHRPGLTRAYHQFRTVVYDKSWFATKSYEGLDISHIVKGSYKLFLKIKISNYETIHELESRKNISSSNKSFSFDSGNSGNHLIIK